MHLRACVRENLGDGEGEDSQTPSNTLRYINLTVLVIGLVTLRGLMNLRARGNEKSEDGEGPDS